MIIVISSALFFLDCAMKEHIDLLIVHGKIYTVDEKNSQFDAMAIKDGKIIALGDSRSLQSKYMADSVIDLAGKPVFPGFIDAHCHFLGLAQNQQYIDLIGARSFDEVLNRVKKGENRFSGGWLVGRGWDQNLFPVNEFPNKSRLDLLFPDRPVLLIRIDGHSVLANEEALKQAKIGLKNKFDPGEVDVKSGSLTGILCEKAADYMRNLVPLPNEETNRKFLAEAERICFAVGLCTVSDAGLDYNKIEWIDSLQKKGLLKMRVYTMLNPTKANLTNFLPRGPYITDRLFVRSIKLYADGSLGSRTALLKKPYQDDPSKMGILVTPSDSVRRICELAYKYGYQVNTHCIGDSAVRLILEIYGSVLKSKNDLRWRIEHAQVVDSSDLHYFSDFSVIPSVQATHATSDMYWSEKRLGSKRITEAYAYKTLLNQNGWLPNGTDFPIEKVSPILTFYAAVARRDLNGHPKQGFQMGNALTREQALRSITIWAARSNFMENQSGSLELGKNADFTILDQDMMQIPISRIPMVKVLHTFVNGEKVY